MHGRARVREEETVRRGRVKGVSTPPPGSPAGHRRLMARAAVRMTPSSIRKGSQVFTNPAQLAMGNS